MQSPEEPDSKEIGIALSYMVSPSHLTMDLLPFSHQICRPAELILTGAALFQIPSWGWRRARILKRKVGEPRTRLWAELPLALEAGHMPAGRGDSAGQHFLCTYANITFYEGWKEPDSICPGAFFGGAGKTSSRLVEIRQ